MKNLLYMLSFSFLLMLGCGKEPDSKKTLTYNDFKTTLTVTMTYPDIVQRYGEPTKDTGSGIHIYVYVLDDLTEVWIGFTDKILYARHMSSSGQFIETII